ncbi:MAG TPA: pirin family protein [Gammaproteobacteria bacterium]
MIELLIGQRRRSLGGFDVGRVLPYAKRRMVGPFIFFDHMGPVHFEPGIPRDVDVRPHPHIGLATITYLFAGEIMHRDSIGSVQPIRPGEVNWMTAGRGITHSERFERGRREGGPLHGIQAWVALPTEHEETEPAFTHYPSDALPTFDDGGAAGRLIAGELWGLPSPVETHSPLFYVHWELGAGAQATLPADYSERALYVASGSIELGNERVAEGHMAVLSPGEPVSFGTEGGRAVVMALGGEPVGHRFIDWNFVSSSKDRIEQAKADWRAGRMPLPVGDDQEWIPLPEEPAAPNPMS